MVEQFVEDEHILYKFGVLVYSDGVIRIDRNEMYGEVVVVEAETYFMRYGIELNVEIVNYRGCARVVRIFPAKFCRLKLITPHVTQTLKERRPQITKGDLHDSSST